MNADALRAATTRAFEAALSSLDLAGAVARDLAAVHELGSDTAILAVGKGAAAMARGALQAAGGRLAAVLVIGPAGGPAFDGPDAGVVTFLEASHPDPDRRSVTAARRALALVKHAHRTLALVSGGTSSLICLPQGLPLARYVRAVRRLSLAGATVRELNTVRRHLCAVKGGGLARAARGPIHALVASDVIGGALHDVGSGPTVADPTTRTDARAVLRRFGFPESALPLHESLKPNASQARRARARFVARPEDLAHAVAAELRASGLRARCLPPSLDAADVLAREYLLRALGLRPGEALVRSAEPSLRVAAARAGCGGRSTHLALLLGSSLPAGVVFLAGASDGVDGTSGAGGAVVDASLRERASSRAISAALARFDSGTLLRRVGLALPGGWTGHNLADVHVLARG